MDLNIYVEEEHCCLVTTTHERSIEHMREHVALS